MEHQNVDDLMRQVIALIERSQSWEAKSAVNPRGMPGPSAHLDSSERVLRRMSDIMEAQLLLDMAKFEVFMQQAENEERPT